MLFGNFRNDLELILCLELCTSGTDDIETAGIPVCIDVSIIEFDKVIIDESARAALETEKHVILVGSLDGIIQTADNVMSAGCLSAGKDNANDLLLCSRGVGALFKCYLIFSVGVREESLDLVLIGYACRSSAVLNTDLRDTVPEHSRKLRGILVSCLLKG